MAFVFFGLLILLAGLLWAGSRWRFISHAAQADGEMLHIEDVQTKRYQRQPGQTYNTVTYYAVAAFTDEQGERREIRCLIPSDTKSLKPGDKVRVFYDRAAPEQGFINHWLALWFGPGIVAGMGLVFVLFVSFCLWVMRAGMSAAAAANS